MNPKHKNIIFWLSKCKKNIENFNNIYLSLSKKEKLKYIQYQYHLIRLIDNVLTGKTIITGYDFDDQHDKSVLKNKIKNEILQMDQLKVESKCQLDY